MTSPRSKKRLSPQLFTFFLKTMEKQDTAAKLEHANMKSGKAILAKPSMIQKLELGVYHVWMMKETAFDFVVQFERLKTTVLVLARLFREVYSLGRLPFVLLQLMHMWSSVEGVVLLGLESRILRIVRSFSSG